MSERQPASRGGDQRRPDPRNTPAGGTQPPSGTPAQPRPHPPTEHGPAAETPSFLTGTDLETVTRRWHEIQAAFVDTPRQAVQDADGIVADLLKRMSEMFATEHHDLASCWHREGQISTEDLRICLQRYRAFLQRLLSVR
jgi:hypothetical protein